jgi:GH15 family glucan-1,4-alpha-glucosidase
MTERLRFIPYQPIEKHGVIGDRRTAALVAADGTLDWLCLPDYDGAPVFGALLDAQRGGFWRLGPALPTQGRQRYLEDSVALVTSWVVADGELELTDIMAWPREDRAPEDRDRRIVVRRLRCIQGQVECALELWPRDDFAHAAKIEPAPGGLALTVGNRPLGLWLSHPITADQEGAQTTFSLQQGEELWAVLALDETPADWTLDRARETLAATVTYWRDWLRNITYSGPRIERMRRSALTIHLLGYAPDGSLVAAPTASLPERLGGDRNYDYRFSWIRDASLSLGGLSLLGDTKTAGRYIEWLAGLDSSTDAPLQVAYHVSGADKLAQRERPDLDGYRGSRPVQFGNQAATQRQLGSFGYLADCVWLHLCEGGDWNDDYWRLIQRCADYICAHWQEPDSGIWELPQHEHFVSSKVMCWVVLDRASKIAARTGHATATNPWRAAMEAIHAEVMERGWSEQLQAFRQRYGADSLDAATLLIPAMEFLPADHPRVLATVDRIVECLTIDGFVHRFIPSETPGQGDLPLGEFEGAFWPCTFWLAETYARAGRPAEAEAILTKAEAVAGDLGIFAEEVDARTGAFLGNTPLLFSQVEYVSAVLALDEALGLKR